MIVQQTKRPKVGNLTTIVFDSTMEMADAAPTLAWNIESNKKRATDILSGSERDGNQQSWLGAPSIGTFYKRLREGWAEGSKRLLDLATREINPASIRRRRVRADQGDEVDMQAVWRGDLSRAWTRTRRLNRTGIRSVSIVVNLGANCGVDADTLFWRGAAALKLADALSQSGYNVAIIGAEAAKRYAGSANDVLAQFVSIKDEDQPLDLDRLAALSAMPGYFRTVMFAGICWAADREGKDVDWGLGSDDSASIAAALKQTHFPQDAFVQGEINSRKQAEDWIDSVLAAIDGNTH